MKDRKAYLRPVSIIEQKGIKNKTKFLAQNLASDDIESPLKNNNVRIN